MPTPPLKEHIKIQIRKMKRQTNPKTKKQYTNDEIAEHYGVSTGTVSNYTRGMVDDTCQPEPSPPIITDTDGLPLPASSEDQFPLPEPVVYDHSPVVRNEKGCWGIISDVHVPAHDLTTLRLFMLEAKRRGCVGILLNGDILDFYGVSDHIRDPSVPAVKKEIEAGKQLLTWFRGSLPKAHIVYREGNHEERLKHYIFKNAPQLAGLDEVTLQVLLQFDKHGIQHVGDRRLVKIGKLPVIHGHEHKHGIAAPVNAARGLFLRAKQSALVSHHHQVHSHVEKTLEGKTIATWSIGCACDLKPLYCPYNNWVNGFAFVEVSEDGTYHVDNMKIDNGRIV